MSGAEKALAALLDYVLRSTHGQEGGATRHDALLALGELGADVPAPYRPQDSGTCPTCGEDGGTSCGMPNCGLLAGEDGGPSYEDRLQEVALLVSQAIGLVDDLASQDRILYAPTYRNVLDHGHKGTRKKTLGDAKREAKQVAMVLRRAWEIADPVSEERLLEAIGPGGK